MSRVRSLVGYLRSLPMWLRARPSSRRHIFITGAPRSGTTLLKTILTAHSRIAGGDYESTGLFKPRDLHEYACGEIDNVRVQALLDASSHLVEFYDRVADELLAHWGGDIFVDKVWPRAYRLRFVAAQFPRAAWIHIVRDGRDCYCSARKHPNVPQGKDIRTFATYWATCIRLIGQYVPAERVCAVRYEDLTADPEGEISTIMRWLDMGVEARQFHPAASSRIPSIRKTAYHNRLSQPLDTRSVGRYELELTKREQAVFEDVAGEVLQSWGYDRFKQ